MRHHKLSPRVEYRTQESQRVSRSALLREKFGQLKTMTVDYEYFSPEGNTRNRQIKYTVNLEQARSVFRLECLNHECVGGDFDLSEVLEEAVAARQAKVTGERCCQGWLNKNTIDQVRCRHIIRFQLSFEYTRRASKSEARLQNA
jgi:hypothetical protein